MRYNTNLFFYQLTQKQWYQRLTWYYILWPFEVLFRLIIRARKCLYTASVKKQTSIPIWVVGDVTVGGSGKSPLIVALVQHIQKTGRRVAIIGHGYQANILDKPLVCTADSDPSMFGDEAIMLAQKTQAVVICAKKRRDAVQYIQAHYPETDLIICDDGLQDYLFFRDKEIVILNKKRIGNGHCFPVGPMREPLQRYDSVDLCIHREHDISVGHTGLYALKDGTLSSIAQFKGVTVHAVSGIANNQAFFDMLQSAGVDVIPHSYIDHYAYTQKDASHWQNYPVIMTEKDAVKCKAFAESNWYVYPICFELSDAVRDTITQWLSVQRDS